MEVVELTLRSSRREAGHGPSGGRCLNQPRGPGSSWGRESPLPPAEERKLGVPPAWAVVRHLGETGSLSGRYVHPTSEFPEAVALKEAWQVWCPWTASWTPEHFGLIT